MTRSSDTRSEGALPHIVGSFITSHIEMLQKKRRVGIGGHGGKNKASSQKKKQERHISDTSNT